MSSNLQVSMTRLNSTSFKHSIQNYTFEQHGEEGLKNKTLFLIKVYDFAT